MKKIILALLFFVTVPVFGQQERLILFGGAPWFEFDPLTSHFRSGSLAQLSSYVDAWRQELDPENVFVAHSDNFLTAMPKAYQLYNQQDSILLPAIFKFLNVTNVDTLKFPISKYITDTLRNRYVLVIDRWDFLGDVTYAHKVVDIGDFPLSKDFEAKFGKKKQQVKHFFSSPLCTLSKDHSTVGMYFGASELGNLLHNFQLSFADVSIVAPPKLNMSFKAGDLYSKDVYDMFVYDNDLSVVEASGAQLKQFMEEVYGDRYYNYRRSTDDLVRIKTPYFFHDGVAGVNFEVNVSNGKGKRIQNHNIEPQKMYKIALNSFRAKWFTDKGCSIRNEGQYRILLIMWLLQNDVNKLAQVESWSIVPNVDINKTIEREKKAIEMM